MSYRGKRRYSSSRDEAGSGTAQNMGSNGYTYIDCYKESGSTYAFEEYAGYSWSLTTEVSELACRVWASRRNLTFRRATPLPIKHTHDGSWWDGGFVSLRSKKPSITHQPPNTPESSLLSLSPPRASSPGADVLRALRDKRCYILWYSVWIALLVRLWRRVRLHQARSGRV